MSYSLKKVFTKDNDDILGVIERESKENPGAIFLLDEESNKRLKQQYGQDKSVLIYRVADRNETQKGMYLVVIIRKIDFRYDIPNADEIKCAINILSKI